MTERRENAGMAEKIVSLAKRRGFVFPSSEIYGGFANAWDFGPYGAQLKKNIKDAWWRFFVEQRDDTVGLDAAIIMNPKVWEASGHVGNFSDPLVECKKCHGRFRADQIGRAGDDRGFSLAGVNCPQCGHSEWTAAQQFNLMLKTFLGPAEDSVSVAYLRPETAQSMFINFVAIQQVSRKKLPFGVAQIGKAFRNEITPGNFIFRTREFEQMEIEYFFDPANTRWQDVFALWQKATEEWMSIVGIDMNRVHAVDIPAGERAHYSERTVDFEFEYPFGQKELFGLAYRGDYDLVKHETYTAQELRYLDPATSMKVRPHVIEPSFGVERGLLAILLSAFEEQVLADGERRIVLHFKPAIAPVQVAVFPLLKNKPELMTKAREIFNALKQDFRVEFDDNGNVGKRYRRQDEIGTPFCVTVDFDTIAQCEEENLSGTVTIRDRDTMKQERIPIAGLQAYFSENLR